MKEISSLRFILHVSDFHLTEEKKNLRDAQAALKALTKELNQRRIKVDYLMHTGDIINASDIYIKVARKLDWANQYIVSEKGKDVFDEKKFIAEGSNKQKKAFDKKVKTIVEKRFNAASEVMKEFISDLNISSGSVVICSGNHDVIRKFAVSEKPTCEKDENGKWLYNSTLETTQSLEPFENFLNTLGVANSQKRCKRNHPVSACVLGNMRILIMNTNWPNPQDQKKGYFCVRCEDVKKAIKSLNESEIQDPMNIVLAHKPVYEICEKARLSYKRYIKTPFLSDLQKFIGKNGVYLCGDKHTRSIVGSSIHDISHYIGGEPIIVPDDKKEIANIEYNLLEICNNALGMERKVHLTNKDDGWRCDIRPQDDVVSNLFSHSKECINKNTYEIISGSRTSSSWESLCQEVYNWKKDEIKGWYSNINNLYQSICKYRIRGGDESDEMAKHNIFEFVKERIIEQMKQPIQKNILNVRGEYDSGKSTFLGLLYIYLLLRYSVGEIDFIPAYFNLECSEVYSKIDLGDTYYDAVHSVFRDFTESIQKISKKECQPICYIIDGIDEQDCWRYSTEDSIGRCLLNILSKDENAWHIMAFSQNKLPCLKNTMPTRKYNDTSDIMYFNPIDVQEKGSKDMRFVIFVESFLKLKQWSKRIVKTPCSDEEFESIDAEYIENICNIIRKFRRLTINLGFIYQNYDFIIQKNEKTDKLKNLSVSVKEVYGYYIDRQYEICLRELGYGFVDYAPAMAYLFSFCGYTYEKFKALRNSDVFDFSHINEEIDNNFYKIYKAFLFIKKHKDAREYLIALHYNKELRYYAENPNQRIAHDSILNKFISRNISVLIRKLWSDTNKFIITCEKFLQREDVSCCTQSLLIYCLAHLDIYLPIRDQLMDRLCQKGLCSLNDKYPDLENDMWNTTGDNNFEKLNCFIDLSLKHSMKIFTLIKPQDSLNLVELLLDNKAFREYNRQFQLLYYGDLSINGDDKNRPLIPDKPIIYKGFDFHNTFNHLYVKLCSNINYPLREFDMFTMFDLIISRLYVENTRDLVDKKICQTFFYRMKFNDKADYVISKASGICETYLNSHKRYNESKVYKYFQLVNIFLKTVMEIRKENCFEKNIENLLLRFENVDINTFDSENFSFGSFKPILYTTY